MSRRLDHRVSRTGTRFLLFAQNRRLRGFARPEVVYIDARPGAIQAGPSDGDLYVVDAIDHRSYWVSEGRLAPPYEGRHRRPATPRDGHFDHIKPDHDTFRAAAAYAAVRRTLDIWEDYLGRRLTWWFRPRPRRLEVIPQAGWDNAASGAGFIELGFDARADGRLDRRRPFCENVDVIAHEVGHAIHSEVIGILPENQRTLQFQGHKESLSDLVAIVVSLHFKTTVNELLRRTHGNLFSDNVVARVADLGPTSAVRRAFNDARMSTVADRRDKYALSAPFTGAAFDLLAEIYEDRLAEAGVISKGLARRSYNPQGAEELDVQPEFDEAYRTRPAAFADALLSARDEFASLLARTWDRTPARNFSYAAAVRNLVRADADLSGGRREYLIRACFECREILDG